MKILINCEESGVVRRAFRLQGHEAYSCDILPSRDNSEYHIQADALETARSQHWDLMIAHPPCTYLTSSANRWMNDHRYPNRLADQLAAIQFVKDLMNMPIAHIAIENPIGKLSTAIRKPDQIVQPYWFGESYTKSTCLWLKNLPLLVPTNMVGKGEKHITKSGKQMPDWYNIPPSIDRARIRSTTFQGLADAMSIQWSQLT